MKNDLYWAFNLPLQVWPNDGNSLEDPRILNYMPRKETVCETVLSDIIGEQTREEFFEQAALILENLAKLMRIAGKDPNFNVYYPDSGMEKDKV